MISSAVRSARRNGRGGGVQVGGVGVAAMIDVPDFYRACVHAGNRGRRSRAADCRVSLRIRAGLHGAR
jgi:hypothetical protein